MFNYYLLEFNFTDICKDISVDRDTFGGNLVDIK